MINRERVFWLMVIWVMTSGFGLLERTKTWKEEVALANGSIVWLQREVAIGPDEFFRPGRGSILRSKMSGDIPGIGEVDFKWDSNEVPITLDVIDGIPWVVLPIAGPALCEKYGYPKESVVAFYLKGKDWVATPFEKAPNELRYNLLGSNPTSGSVVRASDSVKQPHQKYRTEPMGFLLTERFIPQQIAWEHSCPRINPNASSEQHQSVQEFLSLKVNEPSVKVLAVLDDVVRVDLRENYFGVLARQDISKDEFVVSGCAGKIGRSESIRPWAKQSNGMMTSRPSVVRIELLHGGKPTRSVWLPVANGGGTPTLIKCIGSTGYVLINHWGAKPDLVIAQFDLSGSWRNLWRIEYPEAPFKQRGIIDFKEIPSGFLVTVGEVNHPSIRNTGDPLATIGLRYVLEVSY